jgi:hypothetical protein
MRFEERIADLANHGYRPLLADRPARERLVERLSSEELGHEIEPPVRPDAHQLLDRGRHYFWLSATITDVG